MTGGTGQRLNLRLFLEGIEVPVISAMVQANANAPAAASIQIVPTDQALELKPRTMVHLFYWDVNEDLPSAPGEDEEVSAIDPEGELDGYKLLFGGEVTGLVQSKKPGGRNVVLQCADWSTYWDTTYQIFISYSPGGNFLTEKSAVWSGGNRMFDNILSSHSGVMNSFLGRRPKSEGLRDVRGLMGGIISLLEAMGGVPNHTSGINDYFTIAELKNHILQQITAEQNDDTAKRLFDSKQFSAWLNQRLTNLGELVSFRDMLKLLFHYIYYEVVPIPTPKFVPGTRTEEEARRDRNTSSESGFTGPQREALSKVLRISRRFDGSQNVESTLEQQVEVNEAAQAQEVRRILQAILNNSKSRTLQVSTGLLLQAISHSNNIRTIPNRFTASQLVSAGKSGSAGQTKKAYLRNQDNWRRISDSLERVLGAKGQNHGGRQERRKKDNARPRRSRLQSQIFRPDCFFAAPPRCNVVFPDQLIASQYKRNFLQEITRLRLSTGMQFITGKGDGLLQNVTYAPALQDIREVARQHNNHGVRTLLPWEKFTGILPKFEHISEINYFANRRQKKLNRNVRGQARSFEQRAANFNFIKYRFAPRTLMISTKFAPQIAPGFPMLVINEPFVIDPEALRAAAAESGFEVSDDFTSGDLIANIGRLAKYFKAPTQFLGMPASVSHKVDQSSGTTNITLTHARTHRVTDDDFLDLLSKEVKRKSITKKETTVLDAEKLVNEGNYQLLKFLIDATPQDLLENPPPREESTSLEIDDVELERRPTSAPDLSGLGTLAPVVFSGVPSVDEEVTPSRSQSGESIRGGTKTSRLEGSQSEIREPNPYGRLKPGSPGPKGGKVSQIHLHSDSVVQVTVEELAGAIGSSRARRRLARGKDSVLMWRRAAIIEEVEQNRQVREIPIEESIRPPWFSPLYSNLFIGEHIYEPFFGTGSIVDQALFLTPEDEAFFGNRDARDRILERVSQADGDPVRISQILEEEHPKSLGAIPDIERSVDALAFMYGEVRRQGLDVQRFISNYTKRPIATMKQILGSSDVRYERQGDELELVSGEPGFHSTAVAPFGELLGLLDDPDQELPRLRSRGKKSSVSRALDPRPERRRKVEEYAAEVSNSRGSLAVGLLG